MMPSRTATRAEHRVRLAPGLRGTQELATFVVELALGVADEQLLDVGEELVQRRVEQADGDGQAVHRLEDALEVGALELLELVERGLLGRFVGREDEALDDRQPVAEEHVLGAAEPDALGAEAARHLRVVREVGVGAHAERAELVGPPEHDLERPARLRRDHRHRAEDDLAGGAVDRDHVALAHDRVAVARNCCPARRSRARSRRTPPACPCRARRPRRG